MTRPVFQRKDIKTVSMSLCSLSVPFVSLLSALTALTQLFGLFVFDSVKVLYLNNGGAFGFFSTFKPPPLLHVHPAIQQTLWAD